MKKDKLVPKRRFKEFENAGDWEQRKFKDFFEHLQNNALSRADLSEGYGNVLDVHYGDILVKFGEVIDVKTDSLPSVIDEDILDKYQSSILRDGDVIIADAAEDETVGKCSEIKGIEEQKVLAGLHTIPVRPKKKFATGYLGYYMNSNAYHDQLLPLMQGTKVSSISKSSIQETDILYPKSEDEQSKIGEYFTNVDTLITLHQRKLNKLQNVKKAYLSEMFPAEGERKPKRRFAGFTDDWEQRKFKDFFEHLQNNALSRADLSEGYGNVLDVHYGDILVKFGEVIDVKTDSLPSVIDEDILDKYQSSILRDGDVIIADAAEDETVGKCSEIKGIEEQKVLAGLHTIPVRPKKKFATGYLGYYMNSNAYHDQLLPLMQGTKVSSISKSSIQETDILYPKSEDEQSKIGEYFTNVDTLITLHQRKLEKLQNLKKAYLEELFV